MPKSMLEVSNEQPPSTTQGDLTQTQPLNDEFPNVENNELPAPPQFDAKSSQPANYSESVPLENIEQENEDEDEEPPLSFGKGHLPKDHIDMTAMVDVTFLLLIFFMITASFTSEKAIQQKVASSDVSSQAQPVEENETIKILIDEFNAYTVIFPDGGEIEATSKQELIGILATAELDGSNEDATAMVIEAHEDSLHASVIGALDAGRQQGLSNFKVTVVENFD